VQPNRYEYAGSNPVRYTDPTGLFYTDINISAPILPGVGITTGIVFNESELRPYIGGGFVTSPGGSVTQSEDNITPGVNAGVSGFFYGGGQIGVDKYSAPFEEVGIGTPGASFTGYVIGPNLLP
jgi:hypothetical protein